MRAGASPASAAPGASNVLGRAPGGRGVFAVLAAIAFGCSFAACQSRQAARTPPPPNVTVAHPLVQEIVDWDEYTGRLEAVESVEVRSRVGGYLESVDFEDGSMVQKGDLLFIVDPRPFQAALDRARAEADLAEAKLDLARRDLARAKVLLLSRAISEEETDTRAAQLEQAEATLAAARAAVDAAKLDVEFTHIDAPISGRVGRALVDEGNLISGGSRDSTLLTTIVSLDPIYCYLEADERSYLKYMRLAETGERASAREAPNPVWVGLADEEGYPHRGWMDFVDNHLDPQTGTMTGRAIIPNPDLLLTPGLFVRARIAGSGRYRALLVPDAAIGMDQNQRFVWIVDADDHVQYRRVVPGTLHGDLRVVTDGLTPEDRVVVAGVQRVHPGVKVVAEEQALEPLHDVPPWQTPAAGAGIGTPADGASSEVTTGSPPGATADRHAGSPPAASKDVGPDGTPSASPGGPTNRSD